MKYESYSFDNKEEIEFLLRSKINDNIINALQGAINGIDDCKWLQELCLKYINHEDYWVAKTAINGLGDIARVFNDLDCLKVVNQLNQIKRKDLEGAINDTLSDIKMFLK